MDVDDIRVKKVFSQAGYFVLITDSNLMSGKRGSFNILGARSHRITRLCRSTYAAELLRTEAAFDVGILCTASVRGFDLSGRFNEPALGMVDLQVVVDAKATRTPALLELKSQWHSPCLG